MTQPPDLAERLLRWSLADDERDAVLGDMQEEFAVIARVSPARAARWYWSQAPLAPRVRTPFIGLRRAPDGSLSLTMSAPEAPASLADPIVVRAGDSRIAIDRVFSNSDALRVFTLVGEGVRRPRVELDILDSSGNLRRAASPRPDPAELVIGHAPVRQPNVAISKIDASISLRDLPAGRYLLRLTAVDSTHRSDKYAEFTIRD